jgi:hypothetical protein
LNERRLREQVRSSSGKEEQPSLKLARAVSKIAQHHPSRLMLHVPAYPVVKEDD